MSPVLDGALDTLKAAGAAGATIAVLQARTPGATRAQLYHAVQKLVAAGDVTEDRSKARIVYRAAARARRT